MECKKKVIKKKGYEVHTRFQTLKIKPGTHYQSHSPVHEKNRNINHLMRPLVELHNNKNQYCSRVSRHHKDNVSRHYKNSTTNS